VVKFEVHAAPNVLQFEHGTSPGGSRDGDLNRVGTEFRMAREERVTAPEQNSGVAVMHGLNVQDGSRREIVEKNSPFDLRLDDGVVNIVGEIGMRAKHDWAWIRVMGFAGGSKGLFVGLGERG
jgi:hypothetical protein